MCVSVGSVVKLVSPHAVGNSLRVVARLVIIILRVLVRDSRDWSHVCTEHPKEIDFLLTL
jgi:hypothetical protein